MKKRILFIVLLTSTLCANSQSTGFRDFIEHYKSNLNTYTEACRRYFGEKPVSDEFRESKYDVLLVRDHFVGILFSNEAFDYQYEKKVILTTYDWDGNEIDKMEFENGQSGDYLVHSKKCKLNDDDVIICTETTSESGLEYMYNENGDVIGSEYITVNKNTNVEKYIIRPDGKIMHTEKE